jgi:hypothetical protein
METETGVFTTEFLLNKIAEMQADKNKQDTLIKQLADTKENLNKSVNGYYTKEQWLRTYLTDNYDDLEQHAHAIADIFGIALTKEITYSVVINATISAEVPMEELDSIEDFITGNLTVDSYNGEISVQDFEVESVKESYY